MWTVVNISSGGLGAASWNLPGLSFYSLQRCTAAASSGHVAHAALASLAFPGLASLAFPGLASLAFPGLASLARLCYGRG